MTAQLLIYERAVPVSIQRHKDWSIRTGSDYSFARHVNSVPLMAAEFPNAAAEHVVVFAGNGDEIMPTVVLGIRDRENMFVDEAGKWASRYIPAFFRRYPFIFSSSDDGQTFTLCIDEEFSGCNREGRGERLFDSDGERTQYLVGMLEFLKAYNAQFQRTRAFCQRLNELKLLEPMQAQFSLPSGQQMRFGGFMAVERERLKALNGDQLAALAATDELELIYTHLQSMRHFSSMVARMKEAGVIAADSAPPAAAEAAHEDEVISGDADQ